jgi:nucleotide-binding universal stress UspA family protein
MSIDLFDKRDMDMVAMSAQGQNALNLWHLGGAAQKVLLGGDTSLLPKRD